MARARRVDTAQSGIVQALEAAGCLVQSLARLGDGLPDLLVGTRGRWILLEVKSPDQPPNKRRLRPGQQTFHALAEALHLPCFVVMDPRQALTAIGVRFDDEGPR